MLHLAEDNEEPLLESSPARDMLQFMHARTLLVLLTAASAAAMIMSVSTATLGMHSVTAAVFDDCHHLFCEVRAVG